MPIPISPRHSATGGRALAMLALLMVVAACSDEGGDAAGGTTESLPSTATAAPTPATAGAAEAPQAVPADLDRVRQATVRIVGTGTFSDPFFGEIEGAGSGSGFIIDEAGLTITADHVVAGTGLLRVFVHGEEEPRNAKVIGTSECSDLALIDIDGDGFTAVDWASSVPDAGSPVYAAGYPLGETELVLTSGVVGSTKALGETDWASVDQVIEHDAAIQPGNSGGPLVTPDGSVIGINYAGGSFSNTERFFAIGEDEAREILVRLRRGDDVDSVGINGRTLSYELDGLAGLWVIGVTSGSPADEAGIRPGDVVTSIEGVTIGADGTMADYCDVIRTHQPDDVMAIEVYRYDTEERYVGQLNGDELELAIDQTSPFVDPAADPSEEADDSDSTDPVPSYTVWSDVTDDSETLHALIPSDWWDVDGTEYDLDGEIVPAIRASDDLEAFLDGWTPSGLLIAGGPALGEQDAEADRFLDALTNARCDDEERIDTQIGATFGRLAVASGCDDPDERWLTAALFADDGSYGIVVGLAAADDADLATLDRILRNYSVSVGG